MLERFIRDEIADSLDDGWAWQNHLANYYDSQNSQLDPGERSYPRTAFEISDIASFTSKEGDPQVKVTAMDGSVYTISVQRESGPNYN